MHYSIIEQQLSCSLGEDNSVFEKLDSCESNFAIIELNQHKMPVGLVIPELKTEESLEQRLIALITRHTSLFNPNVPIFLALPSELEAEYSHWLTALWFACDQGFDMSNVTPILQGRAAGLAALGQALTYSAAHDNLPVCVIAVDSLINESTITAKQEQIGEDDIWIPGEAVIATLIQAAPSGHSINTEVCVASEPRDDINALYQGDFARLSHELSQHQTLSHIILPLNGELWPIQEWVAVNTACRDQIKLETKQTMPYIFIGDIGAASGLFNFLYADHIANNHSASTSILLSSISDTNARSLALINSD